MKTAKIIIASVLCLSFATMLVSNTLQAKAVAAVQVVKLPEAEQVNTSGQGLLLCAGAIIGGYTMATSLIGAVGGALLVVCGCADYLDSWFGTHFKQNC